MNHQALKNIPWGRLIRFGIVGGSAFAIDFAIYFALTRFAHLPYLLSRCISLAIAMIWNFLLNRYWTFQAHGGKIGQQAFRFIVVMTTTSIISLILMRFGVSVLHLNDLVVLVGVSVLIMLVNFLAHSLWSYRPE